MGALEGLGIMETTKESWHGYFLKGNKCLDIRVMRVCLILSKKIAKILKKKRKLKSVIFREWKRQKKWERKWESLMEDFQGFKEILQDFQQGKQRDAKKKFFHMWKGLKGNFIDPKEK